MDYTTFRPMLAATLKDPADIKFPVLVSPKIDGIRCILHPVLGAITRTLKPIPNHFVRSILNPLSEKYPWLDGELVCGDFQGTQSAIMSHQGMPDFKFLVFDKVADGCYMTRTLLMNTIDHARIEILEQIACTDMEEFDYNESYFVEAGYEGMMFRKPLSSYKFGRSTMKEQYLVKVKRFEDREAKVVGFEEFYHNANEGSINALGYKEHSSHHANMVPKNTLGALEVFDDKFKKTFKVGTGFSANQRQDIWNNQAKFIGQVINYKYQNYGVVDVPRIPVFRGFRKDI